MAEKVKYKTNVYTLKKFNIIVTGKGKTLNLPLSSITIMLMPSSIPTINVIIDPKHQYVKDSPKPDATKAAFEEIYMWYNSLVNIASDPDNKVELDIHLVCDSENAEDKRFFPEQKLHLKEWFLLNVGLNELSAYGGLSISLTIQHPAVYLDRVASNIGDTGLYFKFNVKDADYNNIVTGFARALEELNEHKLPPENVSFAKQCVVIPGDIMPVEEAFEKVRNQITKGVEKLRKYIKWKTTWPANEETNYQDLPFLHSCLTEEEYKDSLKTTIANYSYGIDSESMWFILINKLLSDFSCSLIPTYWDKNNELIVVPFSPWAHPSFLIPPAQISSISIPSIDFSPIGGVQAFFDSAVPAMDLSLYEKDVQLINESVRSTRMFCIPIGSKDGFIGRILTATAPRWMTDVLYLGASFRNEKYISAYSPNNSPDENQEPPELSEQEIVEKMETYKQLLYAYSYEVFLENFRNAVECSLTTCLLINSTFSKWKEDSDSKTGYLVPGCVARVELTNDLIGSGSNGFIDFYVKSITHVIDIKGQAYTTITGAYCRPSDGIEGYVQNGYYNPLFL